ncbi:phage tail tube protein [Sporomusa sp. KB1]|jgi:TP901-1 family phage major tail protein|uniref:phage tail tube protein n=1 Tax=Sporomusa sp. KB1 TaxID=943346 RepID=UPI00119CFC0C|nr:phage tail tube protein [Sporomusa sp. KB1]TWH49594.1 TP901-1 family phage major tail protein [Sporomusa sp. KB1]
MKKYKLNIFELQKFAVVGMEQELPEEPNASIATAGKDYLMYVNIGTAFVPDWLLVGGQRGASLSQSADEISTGHKTSGGFKETMPGLLSWSISLDGLLLLKNEGVAVLRQAFYQRKKINIKLRYPDDSYQVGWAAITAFDSDTPHDGEATLKGTLSGSGPISNLSEVVSKTAADDIAIYFDAKAKVKTLKDASGAVLAANYTTDYGYIIIKGDYLETLTVGEHLFYASLTTGGDIPCVTVIAA